MTLKAAVKTINCTSCGAGLDVLGGGRVQVHVCGYCGSELDAQHNYEVLKKFTDLVRPDSPFQIGMTGEVEGIVFTIIGTLGMEEHYAGRLWRWTDHQLFSPTHGYAYLTVEDGHFTFTRRYRHATRPAWLNSFAVEIAENRPSVSSEGSNYRYFGTSTSEISFVEGEFNWQPAIGQTSTTVSVMSDNAKLGFEQTTGEEEVTQTIYLPFAETCRSFGIEPASGPEGVHDLMPYTPGLHEGFLKFASTGFFFIALALTIFLMNSSGGDRLVSKTQQVSELPLEVPFEITEINRLATIRVSADVDNSWAHIAMFVSDPQEVPVFEAGRTVERYSGRDKDGAWTEGNGRGVVRFTPRQIGEYTLELAVEEAENWSRSGVPVSEIRVYVSQGVQEPIWMGLLAFAFLLFGGSQYAKPIVHKRRRWRGSDWVDDSDDD